MWKTKSVELAPLPTIVKLFIFTFSFSRIYELSWKAFCPPCALIDTTRN